MPSYVPMICSKNARKGSGTIDSANSCKFALVKTLITNKNSSNGQIRNIIIIAYITIFLTDIVDHIFFYLSIKHKDTYKRF